MEKKLTDEEIVKALDVCYTFKGCTNECPYFNKNGRNFCVEDKSFYKDLKDLIRRLQGENESLKKDYIELDLECRELRTESDKMVAEHLAFAELAKKAYEQQKAEIERLMREKKTLAALNQITENRVNTLIKTNDSKAAKILELQKEVERLTEENEYVDMVAKQALADYQNAQVQVDELKAMCKKCTEQAVKDTAKEILTELIEKAHSNGCIDLTVNEVKAWFREDYGVEV